ncbi:MAG TPA: site-2 protease family protein, partial [Polyangiaceae bacterium]|nr:site-2 protease family protein [Polyangiaceae bacterium]
MKLSFRVGAIPVRILPSFFVTTLVISLLPGAEPIQLVLWTLVVLASVLVHELGHAFAGLACGLHPRVDLHGFGGTTSWAPDARLSPAARIGISLAGPGTGFAVGGLVAAYAIARGPGLSFVAGALLAPFDLAPAPRVASWTDFVCDRLLFVNVGWGALNLLPMLPLDGGNVMTQAFAAARWGERPARIVSLAVAALAVCAALWAHWLWPAGLATLFVASNWRGLEDLKAREHDAPMRASLENAYAALDVKDATRVLAIARPIALGAKTPAVRAEALQLLAFGFLLEGRVADADAAVAALPRGFSPHPTWLELRARAS